MKNNYIFQNKSRFSWKTGIALLFANLFHVGLREGTGILHLTSCNLLFGWSRWRKFGLTQTHSWKREALRPPERILGTFRESSDHILVTAALGQWLISMSKYSGGNVTSHLLLNNSWSSKAKFASDFLKKKNKTEIRVNVLIPIIMSLAYIVTCFLEWIFRNFFHSCVYRWGDPHYRPGFPCCVCPAHSATVRGPRRWAVSTSMCGISILCACGLLLWFSF